MKPYEHQERIAEKAYEILKKNLIVYLAMEERTGKTLTSILVAETAKVNKILIITKHKAMAGWQETIDKFKPTKSYTIINYESLHKIAGSFDLVILDESHSFISGYPKTSKTWKSVYKFTRKKPLIFMSATPSAQTYAQLYHQLKLSSWTPWASYMTFYDWHRAYGIPEMKFLAGRQIPIYSNIKDTAYDDVKHLFISYTREELGFEHEPNDVLHYVDLDITAKGLYNRLLKNKALMNIAKDEHYAADTPMKLLLGLHQVEGGTLKVNDELSTILHTAKVDYIHKEFGDFADMVIFYHYIKEKELLEINFKNATILQATSFAEGVDLSMYKTLIIYSMDFSTARYSQRRARQCNILRDEPIDVHYLLVKKGISEQVYNTVAKNKTNFIDSYFTREEL